MAECGIILAGGFATRLRPLSYTKPKPLFPILGKPVLDWVIEKVAEVAEPVVSARYLSYVIRSHINARWGQRVRVVEEDRPLGDGGAVINAVRSLGVRGPIVVANGDVFTDLSVKRLWEFHRRAGAAVTIALIEVPQEEVGRFGIAVLDEGGRIRRFVEKPREPVGSNLANAGFYIFEPEAVREFPELNSGEVKIAKHIIPRLMEKFDIYGYVHRGLWFDIGTHADYLKANFAALDRCDVCSPEVPGAKIIPPVYIGEGATVGAGSVLGPYAVVGAGAKLGPHVRVRESVLMDGVVAEAGAYIHRSIVGEGAVLGRWTRLVEAVVADGVYVKDEVYVGRGAAVGPNREVEQDVKDGEILP
ncbi:sugar phosphate nucleotidyltransferase [Pyrobaculum neutrophilum]|uniref:Nucleotidyl transferase n=1 Tax=Pyrobaculum neutrophilum (strain DSM 2338 / JCM 9278 / NBRC 100436 / V24Sta) TaxID=444157 RepID=B1YDG4_PYRNV|nr:NDP-sugar synthase [Pyrobaculum neutrophilum]ACB39827.1 Nucleotidyl transferase [Pyrobaculum neutrophilum V24Sta]